MDVESLQPSVRRRRSCLDVFLIMSIIFLFVALAAVALGGLMAVTELRSKLSASPAEALPLSGATATTDSVYKMRNFVYLEPSSSILSTSTMKWVAVRYGLGESVGSNYLFDEDQSSLMPKQAGVYFIYMNLNLTCTGGCKGGLLRVQVGDKLTCDVEVTEDPTPVSKKCWTVGQINEQKLLTQMTLLNGSLQNWKLELVGSELGMFLVD